MNDEANYGNGLKGQGEHPVQTVIMQRYVDESAFRVNRREEPMNRIFAEVVTNMAQGSKLPYKELTA